MILVLNIWGLRPREEEEEVGCLAGIGGAGSARPTTLVTNHGPHLELQNAPGLSAWANVQYSPCGWRTRVGRGVWGRSSWQGDHMLTWSGRSEKLGRRTDPSPGRARQADTRG